MLTTDQVLALAPDAAAAAASRKAATPRDWRALGHDGEAAWGSCQGSALYGVMVDLRDHAAKCTCPSRKLPCKHALGLLLLLAAGQVPPATRPDAVAAWLAARAAKRPAAAAPGPGGTPSFDAAAHAEREARRLGTILAGVPLFARFLDDLVEGGLATVEHTPPWEAQAQRLVDAKATALAARVRAFEDLVGTPDWPERLLDELGLCALLLHALGRLDQLPPALAAELRHLAGVPVSTEAVLATGERVEDTWWPLGQRIEDDGALRTRRTWLVGERGRVALHLQFAAGAAPFAEALPWGAGFRGVVAFAGPDRVIVVERAEHPGPRTSAEGGEPPATCAVPAPPATCAAPAPSPPALPGLAGVAALADAVADELARRPWLDRRAWLVRGVHLPPPRDGRFLLADEHAVPLAGSPWGAYAEAGGRPIDALVEWHAGAFELLACRRDTWRAI